MFDDVKYLITNSKLPESLKVSLAILTKSAQWLVWAFIGVGILLNKEYFSTGWHFFYSLKVSSLLH